MLLFAPIGDGDKGGSMFLTGLSGFIEGKQILSHPVTSWAVPLPALSGEEENEIEKKKNQKPLKKGNHLRRLKKSQFNHLKSGYPASVIEAIQST